MASTNWKKATLAAAAAMILHFGKDEREEKEHANKHIDKSKSHLNIYIGADDYAPMVDKVKKRIKEVDKLYPPKKNMGSKRITCILLETPVPQEIAEQGRAEEFLRKTHELYETFFGAENVGGTCCHFDEQHMYTEPRSKEKKISLIHGHTLIAAYAEWENKKTDKKTGEKTVELRKGINGKHCESRARLRLLNRCMNLMCKEEFGIDYNTGAEPRKEKVERLKQETEIVEKTEMLKQTKADLEQQKADLEQQIENLETIASETKADIDEMKLKRDELSSEITEAELEAELQRNEYFKKRMTDIDLEQDRLKEQVDVLKWAVEKAIDKAVPKYIARMSIDVQGVRDYVKSCKGGENVLAHYDEKVKKQIIEETSAFYENFAKQQAEQTVKRKIDNDDTGYIPPLKPHTEPHTGSQTGVNNTGVDYPVRPVQPLAGQYIGSYGLKPAIPKTEDEDEDEYSL